MLKNFFLSLLFLINAPCFAQPLLEEAKVAIEKEQYASAVELLEEVVKTEPNVSENYRWLGRAYGLTAKYAPWYQAAGWAKKARISFEKAVELDGKNIPALLDLRQFYDQAPSFLGGGEAKANKISKRLKALGYKDEMED